LSPISAVDAAAAAVAMDCAGMDEAAEADADADAEAEVEVE